MKDTDGDGLDDATEKTHGMNPCNEDGDGDGILDKAEYQRSRNTQDACVRQGLRDSDCDGKSDPNDADSDNDRLCDGPNGVPEANCIAGEDLDANGRVDYGETDPTDGDTDDDGLSDYDERVTYGTFATDPDGDNDGLPDGFEFLRTSSQRVRAGTYPAAPTYTTGKPMNTVKGCGGLSTFTPHPVGGTPLPVGDTGKYPGQLEDTDSDGLLDILEAAFQGNTLVFSALGGRTMERVTDTDKDGLADGVELQIWGFKEYCQLLSHPSFGGSENVLRSMLRWSQEDLLKNPLRLDANVKDMDGDNTPDGWDLQPYADQIFSSDPTNPSTPDTTSIHPILGIQLWDFQMLDKVDGWCHTRAREDSKDVCLKWPEPKFEIELTIGGAQHKVSATAGAFPEWEGAHQGVNIGDLLTGPDKFVPVQGWGLAKLVRNGLFQFELPSKINSPEYLGMDDVNNLRIELRVIMKDEDTLGDFDDEIDLNPDPKETAFIGIHQFFARSNVKDAPTYVQDFRRIGDSAVAAGRHGDNGDVTVKQCVRVERDGTSAEPCISQQGNQGKGTDAGRIRITLYDPMRGAWWQYAKQAFAGGETGEVKPGDVPALSAPQMVPW